MSAGGMFCLAPCIGCGHMFTFNPERVPSIRVKDVREPICKSCVEAANPIRVENGLPPIVPMVGAYDSTEAFG